MLSLLFLCYPLGISHVVPGINNNSQFSNKNKTTTGLAGSRSVPQERLLNAGHVAQERGSTSLMCNLIYAWVKNIIPVTE